MLWIRTKPKNLFLSGAYLQLLDQKSCPTTQASGARDSRGVEDPSHTIDRVDRHVRIVDSDVYEVRNPLRKSGEPAGGVVSRPTAPRTCHHVGYAVLRFASLIVMIVPSKHKLYAATLKDG